MTPRPRAWHCRVEPAAHCGESCCVSGILGPEAASRFLNPSLDRLHDPMMLAGMSTAVDRILGAIARKERIAIHGDYDVDGVTSTVIPRRALELFGADVGHFIRNACATGMGFSRPSVDRLHADGAVRSSRSTAAFEALTPRDARVNWRRPHHHRPSRT